MSKIAIAADLHLNCNPYGKILEYGLPLKIHDNFAAFDFLISKCLELNVFKLLIVGDVYENPSPTSKIRTMFNLGLQRLLDKGIEIVILVGNHDSCKEHHALEPLKGWNKKLKIVDICSAEKVKDVNFIYVPHTNAIESKEITFPQYISKLKGKFDTSKNRCLLFGHFGLFGAMKNDYSRNKENSDVSAIDLEGLGFEACFLGHYHRRQNLSKTGNVWYVGSTERRDFSEKDQVKGFCIYDLDTKSVEWVDYEARKMIEISGNNYEEISSEIESCEDLKDAIVKVKVLGGDEDYVKIQQKFFDLNTLLKSKEIVFFSGLEKKSDEVTTDDFPDLQVEFKDGVDVFKVVESELLRISELESKEEIQERLSLLKGIQDDVNSTLRLASSTAFSGKRTIRFKWIEYNNFCRFGDKNNVLDLDKLFHNCSGDLAGIASIVGMVDANENEANGAGKSTILEGIAYALYEKMPRLSSVKNRDRKTTTEIIRTNDKGDFACRESFVKLCLGVDESEWIIKRGRKLSKTGDTHTPILEITKDGKPFNSLKMKEPNQVILDLIGMDFEPFCNSVFFAQKDTNKIFTLTQKGKIDTVLNVLGILRDVDEALDIIRNTRKKEAKEKCLALEGKVLALESSAVGSEADLVTKMESTNNLIEELDQLVKTSGQEIEKLQISKTNKMAIQQGSMEVRSKLEETLRTFSAKKTDEKQSIVTEKTKLSEEIRKENAKNQEFGMNKAKLKDEYDKESEIVSSINITDLKNKLKDIELAKSEILVVQKDRKECVEKRSVLIGKKGVLIGNTSQISESIKKYKEVLKVEGDAVVCPYCKSVKDRNHILKEIKALVHTKNAIDTEITSISLEVFEKDKEESGYWSKEGAIQKVIGSEGPVWIEISKYETAEKNLAGIKERTKDLKHSYEVSKGADVTLLQEKLIKLEEASKSVDEKFESDEKKIRSDLTGLGESILSTQQEILAIEKSVAKLNVVISNSHDSSKGWYGEYKTLELRLSSLRQFKANLVSAKKELENQRLIQTRISVLEDLFGSDGIRIKIADIYVPIFNRHLTDFVSILTAGRMHVQLQQGSLDPKITGASSSNYEMLSGGEQDVIRLAANLALGMVSLGSSRSLPETLFLDEVFGSLAPAMQDRVFDLLRHLRGYFSRILVITHNPMLQERFDRVVCVEKIGGISQITLGFVCE